MPVPYSIDLRWRIVWLSIVHKLSPSIISEQMCVSERSVRRYLNLFHRVGDVKLKTQRHGPQLFLGEFEQLILLRIILENTGIYLHEIQDKLYDLFGIFVSASTICRTLKIMGCCRRVIRHVAIRQMNCEHILWLRYQYLIPQ